MAAKILLVDDQELILEALSEFIKSRGAEQSVEVIGTAKTHEQALASVRQSPPDLVLLDLHMPGVNGYETACALKRQWPAIKILMLSNSEHHVGIAQAKAAGADGYTFKSASHHSLLSDITAVLAGDQAFVMPNDLVESETLSNSSHMTLTHRQRQVLKLLASGETAKGIARLLHISPRTAEKHRAEVFAKLESPNPIELVEYANHLGLPC